MKVLSISLALGACLFAFQNFTDETDPESHNENLEYLQIENDVLQTSSDDMKAQQKEAAEQARVAEQERLQAEAKLNKTKVRREQIEVESKIKISQNESRRQYAVETRDRLNAEASKLEKQIQLIEMRIEKAEREARIAKDESKKSRAKFEMLRQRKAQLLDIEKTKKVERQKTSGLNAMARSVASFSGRNDRLPRVLPTKRR